MGRMGQMSKVFKSFLPERATVKDVAAHTVGESVQQFVAPAVSHASQALPYAGTALSGTASFAGPIAMGVTQGVGAYQNAHSMSKESTKTLTGKGKTAAERTACKLSEGNFVYIAPADVVNRVMKTSITKKIHSNRYKDLREIMANYHQNLQRLDPSNEAEIQLLATQTKEALTKKNPDIGENPASFNILLDNVDLQAANRKMAGASSLAVQEGKDSPEKKFGQLREFLSKEAERFPNKKLKNKDGTETTVSQQMAAILAAHNGNYEETNTKLEALAEESLLENTPTKANDHIVTTTRGKDGTISMDFKHGGAMGKRKEGAAIKEAMRLIEYYKSQGITPKITISGNPQAAAKLAAHLKNGCEQIGAKANIIMVDKQGKENPLNEGDPDFQKHYKGIKEKVSSKKNTQAMRDLKTEYEQTEKQLETLFKDLPKTLAGMNADQAEQYMQEIVNPQVKHLTEKSVDLVKRSQELLAKSGPCDKSTRANLEKASKKFKHSVELLLAQNSGAIDKATTAITQRHPVILAASQANTVIKAPGNQDALENIQNRFQDLNATFVNLDSEHDDFSRHIKLINELIDEQFEEYEKLDPAPIANEALAQARADVKQALTDYERDPSNDNEKKLGEKLDNVEHLLDPNHTIEQGKELTTKMTQELDKISQHVEEANKSIQQLVPSQPSQNISMP